MYYIKRNYAELKTGMRLEHHGSQIFNLIHPLLGNRCFGSYQRSRKWVRSLLFRSSRVIEGTEQSLNKSSRKQAHDLLIKSIDSEQY